MKIEIKTETAFQRFLLVFLGLFVFCGLTELYAHQTISITFAFFASFFILVSLVLSIVWVIECKDFWNNFK